MPRPSLRSLPRWMLKSYRATTVACCMGNFALALIVNFLPVIFIPLREQFGLSFEKLGLLVGINFVTQVVTDLTFSRVADRYGARPFVVGGLVLCSAGIVLLAVCGLTMQNPYPGFVAATMLYSCGGGLMELLLSPIVDAIPTDEKTTAMSILHSFYAWGQVAVVLLTTCALLVFSAASWPYVALCWAVVPLANAVLFTRVPIAPQLPAETRMPVRVLLAQKAFIIGLFVITFSGMSEVAMSQWASATMEKALGLSKVAGDIAGLCMFGVMLGVGRMLYGIFGARVRVYRVMVLGAAMAIVCYLTVSLVMWPPLALAACALTGIAVSLLWPGSLSLASRRFPLAGVSMFAIMAAGGDIGAAAGPTIIGFLADRLPLIPAFRSIMDAASLTPEAFGLRAALFVATVFPVCALVGLIALERGGEERELETKG